MNQQLGIDLYHYQIWVYAAKQTLSKAPLSHFYGPCPVALNGYIPHEEELLSPGGMVAFVVFFCFDCHLHTRPAVLYFFHYSICMSLDRQMLSLLLKWVV